jgi:hypothetical protein
MADLGNHGNGHMIMREKNSDETVGFVMTWIEGHTGYLGAPMPIRLP